MPKLVASGLTYEEYQSLKTQVRQQTSSNQPKDQEEKTEVLTSMKKIVFFEKKVDGSLSQMELLQKNYKGAAQ